MRAALFRPRMRAWMRTWTGWNTIAIITAKKTGLRKGLAMR